jgi:E3 ubiquitin-protein ligase HECTD1
MDTETLDTTLLENKLATTYISRAQREPLQIRDEETYKNIVDVIFITQHKEQYEEPPNLFELLSSKLFGCSHTFVYSKDYDKQGILYYLGTNKGTEEYKNPHDRGIVTASASSVSNGYINQFVDRVSRGVRLYTAPAHGEYFMVDFHNLLIRPTHYTLTHMSSDNVPIHWSVYGGNNGTDWTLLKSHHDDRSLLKNVNSLEDVSFTWPLDVNDYYSKFKFQHDGMNESNLWYFIVERLEMYGDTLNL